MHREHQRRIDRGAGRRAADPFVCNHNAGRSQMAQALFGRYVPEDVHAQLAGSEPAAEIRACAEAVLDSFSDARIDSHVLALAYRQTRECLRRQTCDLSAIGGTT